jgi:uncharacterized protein YdhG (YjbR/CyaY superfamily)
MATKPTGEAAVHDKIASLPAFRDVAARLHEVIREAAPELEPRLWYGMPGYAATAESMTTSSSPSGCPNTPTTPATQTPGTS